LAIGYSPIGSTEYLDGKLFDVRLYNTNLTDEQVTILYGLVGHWKLDETSGTTATDSTLNLNHGTYTGGVTLSVPGPFPNVGDVAAEFDGVDDYVTIPDNSTLKPTSALSVTGWVRGDAWGTGTDVDVILRKGDANPNNWQLAIADGKAALYLDDSDGGGVRSTTTLSTGQWCHVAATWDGTQIKIYVNGALETTQARSGTISTDTRPIYLGGRSGADLFDGGLDDVRIYNRALSAEEIAAMQFDVLMAHWTFNEGSGTTVADSSVYNRNAAFNTGTPTWTGGVRGGALQIIGLNDADTNAAFDPPSTGSVAFWFRTNGQPVSRQRLFGLSDAWEVRYETGGTLNFDLSIGSGFSSGTSFVDAGQWHHVVAIYNSGADTYSLYLDGKFVTSGTMAFTDQGAAILSFGTRTGSTERFSGALDDFRVYNYELTAVEIAELYGWVGHWMLDEGSGGTATDSTVFGNHGALSGASWTTACSGEGAVAFDGSNDYISIPDNAKLKPTSALSVAGWARGGSWGTGSYANVVIRKGEGNPNNWQLAIADGHVALFLDQSDNQGFRGNTLLNTDQWYHVAATWDGTEVRIFLNGELDNTPQSRTGSIGMDTRNVYIGGRSGSTDIFDGAIRDVRFYDRPLQDYEIARISGVIARWDLNESSGTVAVDTTVAKNDATYVNNPTLGVAGPYPAQTGTAVEFDGSSEYITAGKSLLNNLTAFSLMGWVRPDNSSPDKSFFGQTGLIEVGIDTQANQIDLFTNAGGSISASVQLPFGKWSHVAAVGNGSELKLYVNGLEVSSGGSTTANYGSNTSIFKVGEGVITSFGGFFDGRLDEVRVYNRAVCPEEVHAIYKGSRPSGVRIIEWLETR
jgi:hypothetical protein